jgi:hypothetical protein
VGAYVIIGLELALLYFAFWLVFLRRPAVYKVDQPLWGVYSEHADELHKHDKTVLMFSDRFEHGAQFVVRNASNKPNSSGPKAA